MSSVDATVERASGAFRGAAKVAGPLRGAVFFGALIVTPLFGLQHWVLNMLVFVLMFAVMSSAWNLVGGFAGYPSLGHAAFFGIGAYAIGLIFKNHPLTSGLRAVPLVAGRRAGRRADRLANRGDLHAHAR